MEKSQTNATSVTLHQSMQAIWGDIWKRTVEKNKTSVTIVTLHQSRQTNATIVTLHQAWLALWEDICNRVWHSGKFGHKWIYSNKKNYTNEYPNIFI